MRANFVALLNELELGLHGDTGNQDISVIFEIIESKLASISHSYREKGEKHLQPQNFGMTFSSKFCSPLRG